MDGVEIRRSFSTIHLPGRTLAGLDRALLQLVVAAGRG
jgi:hypothetical protein